MTEILTFSKCTKNDNNDDDIKSGIWLRKQQMVGLSFPNIRNVCLKSLFNNLGSFISLCVFKI